MARTPKIVEDRREQIMDAAMQIFAQKGFVRATNKDIARAAGITPGLIYHYFKSKEDLLRAAIEERSPLPVIRAMPAQMLEQPAAEVLRFIIQQGLSIVEHERFVTLIRVFLPEAIQTPAIAAFGLAGLDEMKKFVENFLRAKMANGELRQTDAGLTAQVLLSNVMGLVLRRQVLRDPAVLQYSQDQLVDSLVTTTLQGLMIK